MRRRTHLCALLLACAPAALLAGPAIAEPAEIAAVLQAVTLFPQGAQVTRTLTVPAGTTEILVPNLPDHTDPATLRVAGAAGVTVGAVRLIDARQPVNAVGEPPELQAARRALQVARETLEAKEDAVAMLNARVAAAVAQGDFLRGLDTANTTPEDVGVLARAVAEGVQMAEQARISAVAEVRRAEAALEPEREALERARQALEALENPSEGSDSLLLTVAGAGVITVTTFAEDAGWAPSYDLRLDSAARRLTFERYVSVHQASGEDWGAVKLTLSTARPSERAEPTELWPDLRRIGPPLVALAAKEGAEMRLDAPVAEPAPMVIAERMVPEMQGETLTYSYPDTVDIRAGVEDLRLRLDRLERPVELRAEAVPMFDDTAFRVAEGVNGAEPILPGEAVLWLDGALVGATQMPFTAAGDKLRLGFGAIDGIRLKRVIPQASEGDRGLISKSNERSEEVKISVENLTDKAWPVRLIDRVPYAEQDDLKITHSATPAETTADWHDKRGVLAWEFSLAPGAVQQVTLDTTMRWPADQELR
ncbi:DUF4139 domain-containing protein [Rhodobacter lacus]|uniref:DUF4139 domain-containing protein n=1 Tax=Rhodobacter lacus TaxID=1641972 RepID=A0ABW5A5D8_9RHOB